MSAEALFFRTTEIAVERLNLVAPACILLLQSRWLKWHVISPMMTAGVTSSLLWAKQFSIIQKTGHLPNLVPLQRDWWWDGVMPCEDPSK